MVIKVCDSNDNGRPVHISSVLIERKRAIADMLRVYKSNMYINEKNYTMRLIENLFEMRYYSSIESIFGDKQ